MEIHAGNVEFQLRALRELAQHHQYASSSGSVLSTEQAAPGTHLHYTYKHTLGFSPSYLPKRVMNNYILGLMNLGHNA
jgi:hypothetical protein